MATRYMIECRANGYWSEDGMLADGNQEANRFDSPAEAWAALADLQAVEPEFLGGEYRVSEIDMEPDAEAWEGRN